MAEKAESAYAGQASSAADGEKDWLFGHRYRVVRQLKKAQDTETLLAADLEQGGLVVIKATANDSYSAAARMRLEHEAVVLRQLRSEWFAPLVDFGQEAGLVYLVMPYLEGQTLEARLHQGPLSLRDTLTVGLYLLKALREAHAHGILHRDLKPANILVNDGPDLQKATIIDFGLARSAQLDASLRNQAVGTARYVSPEQAGLLDHEVDERSDLYGAGVVLFECMAGRPPFEADNVGELLRQHLTAQPPELRGLGIAVPRALDEIVQRLLRKDPRDRYQSAEAVLEDLELLAQAVERGVEEPVLVVGRHDRRRTLTEPAFVGRTSELAALDNQLERARAGQGGLVLLAAQSGGGKTRLLAELAQRGARQGVWVLRGQGLDQVGQRPFQTLAGVVEGIAETARSNEELAHSTRARLGDQAEAACAALPCLADVLGVRMEGALGPETFGQARSLEALTALLNALGSPERPALVILDDCQWSDELTLRLVGHWQRRQEQKEGPCHLLLVAAYRSEELAGSPHLREVQPALHLHLPPFGPEDVRLLAESMAGPLPPDALEVVQRFSEGSPFLAAAVLQGLVESEAVVHGPAGWRIEPTALADVQSSRHAATFLARRIQLLPAPTLRLLSAGAVLGKEFDITLAAALAEQLPAEVLAALEEGRRRHIVWACPQPGCYAFLHDKLRQTLLERLASGERRQLHERAAHYLERQPKPCPFQLAYHFDAAGQSRRAFPHALAAAEQARAQHSLQVAEQQYRIAQRGAVEESPQTRSRVAEGLADILMLQGRYDEAKEQMQVAGQLAQDRVVQARVEGKLGELAFKRGDMATAIASLEQGLRLLGKPVPRWGASFLLLCCWEVLVQVLHSLVPRLFLARRPLAGADTELLVIRLYSRLTYAYWFERGRVPCLWVHLREMNLAERYPPTPELAQAYSEHAPVMSLLLYFRRGIAYAERSLAIRRALGDPWGEGQSLHFYGVVLYAASRFTECIEKCQQAVRLLRRTGDFWEVNIACYQIAASLYRLGDLEGARAEARCIHRSGLELGDGQASGISLDVWARASEGKVPPELIRAELERPSKDAQRTGQVLLAQGVHLLAEGRPADAVAVLEQAGRVIRTADVRNAYVSPLLPWLTTALRRQLETLTDRTPQRRRDLERRLREVSRQGLRLARGFQNELPHALRECALLAARQGQLRRARRFFDESLAVAVRQGARQEHAQTLLARGQVGLEAGWPAAADDVTHAERALAALRASAEAQDGTAAAPARPVTLSLADRFDALLDVGRRLASSLTREAITSAVREAGLRLLRGEHCTVLEVGPEHEQADLTVSSSSLDIEFSRAMVQSALARGRAVAFVEGLSDSTSESLMISGMRSSLCAPIQVRGRPAACFHVTHRQVARLFGADEERLADFIATLASAAMENAENFAELRRLNETLELRIRERKEAEKRIQEQAALLDKARDAIAVLDLQDQVLYWNRSAERLYGWTAAEALGRSAAELFRGAADQLQQATQAVYERGEWTGEMQQLTRQGEKITVESRWTLVRDDDGRPTSRLLVNTDITEKKKVEGQFLRAQRMESIGTLAGGIAHDLNNMLAPILMAADLMKEQTEDPALQPFLEIIQSSAERGAAMVRQILSFARGVEGQRVMVQLKHLIRDLEKVLTSTLPKSIVVETHLPHEVGVISGDATQLYQVVMNLCVNARDAMPTGGRLSISVENQVLDATAARMHPSASAGNYVVMHVSDTGTGIPPEILERIFDPFFTTKEVGKGTGLGLSTVLGIVRGHGGFVTIASEVGKGTTFSVYLPAAAEENTGKTEGASGPARGQGELILVVDDEAPLRALMSAILEGHGYRVKTACEGNEALLLYAEHQQEVRLLLTDMMMPVMDGPAAIRALREVDPGLPILVTSGFVDPAGQSLLSTGQVQGFLPKPFTTEQLLETVGQALVSR